MDDAAANTFAPPRSRSRSLWQFSLRELLLLTVIVGLAVTVWRLAAGKFEPTSFLGNLMVSGAVDDALVDLTGEARVGTTEVKQLVAGYQSGSEEIGIKHICLCRFPQGTDPPAGLLTALQRRLQLLLAEAECEVVYEGENPGVNSPRFPELGFFINYRHGKTGGLLNVDAVPRGSDLEIYVLVHEFRAR